MAGAIAGRRTVLGTAPQVGLLTVNAFTTSTREAEGTTFSILKGSTGRRRRARASSI